MNILLGIYSDIALFFKARKYVGQHRPATKWVSRERRTECQKNITQGLKEKLSKKGYQQMGKRYFVKSGKEFSEFIEFNYTKNYTAIACAYGSIKNEDLEKVKQTHYALSFYASAGNFYRLTPPDWKYDFCWVIKDANHDAHILKEISEFIVDI